MYKNHSIILNPKSTIFQCLRQNVSEDFTVCWLLRVSFCFDEYYIAIIKTKKYIFLSNVIEYDKKATAYSWIWPYISSLFTKFG